MDLHHTRGLHDAQNLLRDAGAFLQDLPDELGRVPLTDLVKELHHHPETTFLQTNLVSDGFVPAGQTDHNLINPWGMSSSSTSPIWISENGTGLASIYGVSGGTVTVDRIPPVTIAPAIPGGDPAAPTGQVFNAFQADNAFMLSDGQPASFLFATEDGTISGWNAGAGTQSIITVNEFDRPVGRRRDAGVGSGIQGAGYRPDRRRAGALCGKLPPRHRGYVRRRVQSCEELY